MTIEIVDINDVNELEKHMGDEGWSDWVLSQLRKDEKYDDKPTCDGLRRLAIRILGPMDITTIDVHAIAQDYAAVSVRLKFSKLGQTVIGSAEVHSNNTDAPFSQYPLATAETRAIGRALRVALNLRKVITAEEGSRKANISIPIIEDQDRSEGSITDTQIKFLDLLCKKNDISIAFAVESAVGAHDKLEDLTNEEAKIVSKLVDVWIKEKPEDLKTYDPNWKSSF